MSDWKSRAQPADDWKSRAEAVGEAGNPGPDPYADGPNAHVPTAPVVPTGTAGDAVKSWANKATAGLAPEIEGAMGVLARGATDPLAGPHELADTYRGVRDMGQQQHDAAGRTLMGQAAAPLGSMSMPIPFKPAAGATIPERTWQAAKVGGGVGVANAIGSDPDDLTQDISADKLKRLAASLAVEGGGGMVGGAVTGGALAMSEAPARQLSRRLPMDMLGVSEPARRSMQRQGIYDAAGDDLLSLVRPLRSGMRRGSLVEDAKDALASRSEDLDHAINDVDRRTVGFTVQPTDMAESVQSRAEPFSKGSIQDKQVAARMSKEGDNVVSNFGDTPMSLSDAEKYKQRFGPQVAKELRHAGEPAAKTTALAETYRALKEANEAAAAGVHPKLGENFVEAKQAYGRLAAPLEGANIDRSGMRGSDFDLGNLATEGAQPGSPAARLTDALGPFAGMVRVPLDIAGRAYGRGALANASEFLANRAANNTGGAVGGSAGAPISASLLGHYLDLLHDKDKP